MGIVARRWRGDIVSRIKDRQYKFFHKLKELTTSDAIVVRVMEICKGCKFLIYYENLHDHNYDDDITAREIRVGSSEASMVKYYMNLCAGEKSCIYQSFLCDDLRAVITRWRLSNHDLKIEKGRYQKVPREERVCDSCELLEDEKHVIFDCPLYDTIRRKYDALLMDRNNIKLLLNPTIDYAMETARLIREIEALRKE